MGTFLFEFYFFQFGYTAPEQRIENVGEHVKKLYYVVELKKHVVKCVIVGIATK